MMHIQYPMMFKINNPAAGSRSTHAGVQEFSAEEGRCYLPHWMMQNLLLEEGSMIVVRNVQLLKAKFIKLRPHSETFLDLKNPRDMFEKILRNYSALTVGDVIKLHWAKHDFYFDVMECKPGVSDATRGP